MSHYDSAYSSNPDVALIHTVYGEPVDESLVPNSTLSDVARSTGSLFRPYRDPDKFRNGKPTCATDKCRAFPLKETGHCVGHSRSLGMIENWNTEGRKKHELSDLQQMVWAQTDTTSVDLSAQTIEGYLDEAFTRTIAAENRWPFYEQTWQLPQVVGDAFLAMPVDMNPPAILSIYRPNGGGKLTQISQEEAESRFTNISHSGGWPGYYSIWANRIWMWPLSTQTDAVNYIVRGYRKPLTTFNAPTGQVDADPRFHRCLGHYAIALAYAQQEDDVLEARYMDRWERDAGLARKAIMDPAGNRPLVMFGNFPGRRGVPGSSLGGGGGTGVTVL